MNFSPNVSPKASSTAMARVGRSWLGALALFGAFTNDGWALNQFIIEAQTVTAGVSEVEIPILFTSEEPLFGVSFSLQFDPTRLAVRKVIVEGTETATAQWSEGSIHEEEGELVWSILMGLDQDPTDGGEPFDRERVIPAASTERVLAKLVVDVIATSGTAQIDFQDDLPSFFAASGLRTRNLMSGSRAISPQLSSGLITIESVFDGTELFVNCGGPRLDEALGTGIGDGRIWLEDTQGQPSTYLTSANERVADFGFDTDTRFVEPRFVTDGTGGLFSTERWIATPGGAIQYAFPLQRGTWEVTLLFAEGCCSDGRDATLADPALSAGDCRVFDIYVGDEPPADPLKDAPTVDQFSQVVELMKAFEDDGSPVAAPSETYGTALAMGPFVVDDTDSVVVHLQDLGAGNPPENASINGIALECIDCSIEPIFKRGDTDSSGVVDISDPILNLTFQFVGGIDKLPCEDAADVDDSGVVDISDPVNNLTFQFVGGIAPPPAPGPVSCGPDATPADVLDCKNYPQNKC